MVSLTFLYPYISIRSCDTLKSPTGADYSPSPELKILSLKGRKKQGSKTLRSRFLPKLCHTPLQAAPGQIALMAYSINITELQLPCVSGNVVTAIVEIGPTLFMQL